MRHVVWLTISVGMLVAAAALVWTHGLSQAQTGPTPPPMGSSGGVTAMTTQMTQDREGMREMMAACVEAMNDPEMRQRMQDHMSDPAMQRMMREMMRMMPGMPGMPR